MAPLANVEWAINETQEILVAFESRNDDEAPKSFLVIQNVGYLLFESSAVASLDIPEEILVQVVAAADILILSLRGGEILTEKRVAISRG